MEGNVIENLLKEAIVPTPFHGSIASLNTLTGRMFIPAAENGGACRDGTCTVHERGFRVDLYSAFAPRACTAIRAGAARNACLGRMTCPVVSLQATRACREI